jgi:hypothetical protein
LLNYVADTTGALPLFFEDPDADVEFLEPPPIPRKVKDFVPAVIVAPAFVYFLKFD